MRHFAYPVLLDISQLLRLHHVPHVQLGIFPIKVQIVFVNLAKMEGIVQVQDFQFVHHVKKEVIQIRRHLFAMNALLDTIHLLLKARFA